MSHISRQPDFQDLGRVVDPQYTSLVNHIRSERELAGISPPNIIMIGDFGKNSDDDKALQFLAKQHQRGLCRLKGAIANLRPVALRARQAKQILKYMNLGDIPVAIGTKATNKKGGRPYPSEFSEEVLRTMTADAESVHPDGQQLLKDKLDEALATQQKLTMLCTTSARDLAMFLAVPSQAQLFKAGVSRMVLQGGQTLSREGHLLPYAPGTNNAYDLPAAEAVYRFAQENNIPTSSHLNSAAHVAPLPASNYRTMRATGHPTLIHCANSYFGGTQHFWERACGPAKDRVLPRIDGRWCLERLTRIPDTHGQWEQIIAAEVRAAANGEHVDITSHLWQQPACDLLAAMDAIGPTFMRDLGMMTTLATQDELRRADQQAWVEDRDNLSKEMPCELLDQTIEGHVSIDKYSMAPRIAVMMQASAMLDTAQ